jgi:hypothetical protein
MTIVGNLLRPLHLPSLRSSVLDGTAVAFTPPRGARGFSYQTSLGPFPRPVSHTGSHPGAERQPSPCPNTFAVRGAASWLRPHTNTIRPASPR